MSDIIGRLLGDYQQGREMQYNISSITVNGHRIQLGSFQVTEAYSNFIATIALYALHQMILNSKVPFIVDYKDFASPPSQYVIKTDVNTTDTVFVNYFTIINDIMLTVRMLDGMLVVAAYTNSKASGTEFFELIQQHIKKNNFYRGKCLYFSGDGVELVKPPTQSWDDIIIDPDLKREIQLNAQEFFNDEYRKLGLFKRGIILYGPPGTGKTSIVRAIFTALEGKDITRIYLTNETFSRVEVSTFFKSIGYLMPAIVVFEDIDLIGGNRNVSRSRVIGALLNHLDGVDKTSDPLVMIGTTNDLEALDEALRNRPARFDRCLEVPLPKSEQILQFYKKLAGIEPQDALISESDGFTGAHIEETVNTAFMMALNAGFTRGSVPSELLHKYLLKAAKHIRRNFQLRSAGAVGFNACKKDDDYNIYIDGNCDVDKYTSRESIYDINPDDFPNKDNA
ncbi:MAG: ATP-binding protein [Nitrososphaerales archaeon]